MKTKQRDVVRWLIWFQVAVFILLSVGTLADYERIPKRFLPPQWLVIFCGFAMWTTPLVVITALLINKSGQRKGLKLLISIVIAFVSVWASLPMVR